MRTLIVFLVIFANLYGQYIYLEKTYEIGAHPKASFFSLDGKYMAVERYFFNDCLVFDVSKSNPLLKIQGSLYISNFSYESDRIVFLKDYGKYQIVNIKTGNVLKEIKAFPDCNSILLIKDYFIFYSEEKEDGKLNRRKIVISNLNNEDNSFAIDIPNKVEKFLYVSEDEVFFINSENALYSLSVVNNKIEKIHQFESYCDPEKLMQISKDLFSYFYIKENNANFILYNLKSKKIEKEILFDYNFNKGVITKDKIITVRLSSSSFDKEASISEVAFYDFNQRLIKKFEFNHYKDRFGCFNVINDYLFIVNKKSAEIAKVNLITNEIEVSEKIKVDVRLTNVDYKQISSLPPSLFKEAIEPYLKKYKKEKNKFDLSDIELFKLNVICNNNISLLEKSDLFQKYKDEIMSIITAQNLNPVFKNKYLSPSLYINSEYHSAIISSVKMTSDGKEIVTASWDKTIRVWDFETGKLKRIIYPPFGAAAEGAIYAMDISKDNKYLVVGGYSVGDENYELYSGDFISLIDYQTGRILDVQTAHTQAIFSVAFSEDNKHIASGGGTTDGCVAFHYIFNDKIKYFKRVNLQSGMVRGIKFIPNSNQVVAVTEGGLLFQIQPEELDTNGNTINQGSMAMIGASPGKMMVIQTAVVLNGVVVTNDGKTAITIAKKPQFHYLKEGKLSLIGNDLKPYKYLNSNFIKGDARFMAISPDNRYLATGSSNSIVLYDLQDTSEIKMAL